MCMVVCEWCFCIAGAFDWGILLGFWSSLYLLPPPLSLHTSFILLPFLGTSAVRLWPAMFFALLFYPLLSTFSRPF